MLLSDAEFIFAEKTVMTYITEISEVSRELQEILVSITNCALEDQMISAKLNQLAAQLALVEENSVKLAEKMNGKSYSFIEQIDQIDQFIY